LTAACLLIGEMSFLSLSFHHNFFSFSSPLLYQALVVLAFWAAVMPTLMNPGHQLATGDFGMIGDSNLYFFSWLGLIGSFVVFVRYLKAAYGLGACGAAEKDSKTFKAQTWAGLVLTSFVVFVSASRLCQNANCNAGNSEYDKRTKLAISIGVISAVISLIWMAVGSRGKQHICLL